MKKFDVIILGAGAAGMFAALHATQRRKHVAIIDMGHAPLRKVFISGGGRCNFTNMSANAQRYFGENPHFVRSALSQFSPTDMLDWVQRHNIVTVQKAPGQYFCKDGAQSIINALQDGTKNADLFLNTTVQSVTKDDDTFTIKTSNGVFCAPSVIVATGGLSFPNTGVSDTGMRIAKQFGHKIVPVRPGLCTIITDVFPSDLAGISINAQINIGREKINDSMLFTHVGIGGPAVYRASVRDLTRGIHINLMPNTDVQELLWHERKVNGKRNVANCLTAFMPTRLAKWIMGDITKNIADLTKNEISALAAKISDIFISYDKMKLNTMNGAEVMYGGVATDKISSKTMESMLCPGLFFAGEVMDVTGDLGGFNLQWAWASGFVAGNNA